MRAGAHHQTSGHLPLRRFRSPLRRGSAISRIRAHGRASLRLLCVDRFLEETKRGAGPRSLGRAGADERRDQHGRNVQAACFHLGQHFEAIHLGHLEVADQATRARHHVRRQECRADANSRASPPSERTKLPAAARTKGSSSTMDTRSEAESEKGIPAYGEGDGTARPEHCYPSCQHTVTPQRRHHTYVWVCPARCMGRSTKIRETRGASATAR